MNDKFKQAASQYEAYSVRIKELQSKQAKVKDWIGKYVQKHGNQKYEGINCFMQYRTKVEYDIEAIKKRFGKQAAKFVDDHLVFDTSSFLRICKENGIDRKLFLSEGAYERKQEVDEKKLTALVERGDVSLNDVKDCCTVEESSGLVIRLS